MSHRSLSLPIRRSLEGVSWASLSVRWVPTMDQKRRLWEEIEPFSPPGGRQERRPPLSPVNGRRFPFERFYARIWRTHSNGRPHC